MIDGDWITYDWDYEDNGGPGDWERGTSRSDGFYIINGSDYNQVFNDTIRDWHHNHIDVIAGAPGTTCNGNLFFDNLLDRVTSMYTRGISVFQFSGTTCNGNKFYRNYLVDMTIRSQIGGTDTELAYCIFDGGTLYGLRESDWIGYQISAEGGKICLRVKAYNNAFINIDIGRGIQSVFGADNVIATNNLFINMATSLAFPTTIWDGNQTGDFDEVKNNFVYKEGGSAADFVFGIETYLTISDVNNNLSYASGNLGQYSNLSNVFDINNLLVPSGSPLINGGVSPTGATITKDFYGNEIVGNPPIGPVQESTQP